MEREKRKSPKEISFYYVRHTIEEADFVWEQIKDADIYLIEAVGLTTNERSELSDHVARLSKNKSGIFSGLGKADFFRQLGDSEPFAVALLSNIIDNKKSVYFIDGGPNDPGFREDETALKMFDYAAALVILGDLKKSWEAFLGQAMIFTKAMNLRNNFVLGQIDTLMEQIDGLENKKLAVVQGAAHSFVYNNFRKSNPGIKANKRFLIPGRVNYTFPLGMEFERRHQLGQTSKLQEEILKRDFIANFALFEEIKNFVPGVSLIGIVELSSQLARKIPKHDLEDLFEELKLIDITAKTMSEKNRGEFVRSKMSEIGKGIIKKYYSEDFGL
jgi:hypothetical protein